MLSGLWAIVVLRNLVYGAFNAFLPLLLQERGMSAWAGGIALSVFLAVGAAGGMVGGYFGDRFSRKAIFVITMVLASVWMGFFMGTGGPLSMAFLVLGGFFLMMSGPLNLVMAQEMLPTHASLVASLMMGFAYGVGALAIVVVGAVSDRLGMPATLSGVVVIPLIAAAIGASLPRRGSPTQSGAPEKDPSLVES
jgi:FSR family fosmidomycin resistance protein-like MFS transporter